MDKQFISVREAGRRFFGVGHNSADRLRKKGYIPAMRVGRNWKVDVERMERRYEEVACGIADVDREIGRLVTDNIDTIDGCLKSFANAVPVNRYLWDDRYTAKSLNKNFLILAEMRKKLAPDDHCGSAKRDGTKEPVDDQNT